MFGRSGAVRHRRMIGLNDNPLSKPSIVRLCHKSGIRRISLSMYAGIQWVIQKELEDVVNGSYFYADNAKRKTLYPSDLVQYCRLKGNLLYGFENHSLLLKNSKKKTTRQKNKIKKERLVKKELSLEKRQEKDSKKLLITTDSTMGESGDDDNNDADAVDNVPPV